jgi:hypothetical protein
MSKEVGKVVFELAAEGGVGAVDAAFAALEALHLARVPVAVAAINSVITMCAHLKGDGGRAGVRRTWAWRAHQAVESMASQETRD